MNRISGGSSDSPIITKLTEAIKYIDTEFENADDVLEEIIKEGLIQRFEYTYEMAWNVMKDYALYQGNTDIGGSRDAIRYAFSTNLVADGDMWMEMIKSRIKTLHTYNEETAQEIFIKILEKYHSAFLQFQFVFANYSAISRVILYGSRAKSNYHNSSDIDLSMVGKDLDLTILLKIENELDDLLLPYKIDLSVYHLIENHDLIDHIDRVGAVFYEKLV